MQRGVFVTGTDTEIGKTVVSRLLVDGLVRAGEAVAVMKPVSAGCELRSGRLQNEDALSLMAVSNIEAGYELVNPYALAPPVSPHLAAAEAGVTIDLAHIRACLDTLAGGCSCVVVEGVGGWLVPLSDDATVEDMVLSMELPVILVVGMRLGCLNHALLANQAIRASGARMLGWVANCLAPDEFGLDECVATLERRLEAPLLAVVPPLGEGDTSDRARGAGRDLSRRVAECWRDIPDA